MKKNYFLFPLSIIFLANPALANTWTPVTTISAGPAFENGGSTQTFYLTPDIEKAYIANHTTHTLFDGEIFVGLQTNLSSTVQTQLGLAAATTSSANLSGVILDDADPAFDNYTYQYKIQHTQLAMKGKLLAEAKHGFIPWISATLGVGFNKAYGFTNTPTIPEALPNPNFTSHTQTAFTWAVGIGIQKILNPHWQVGIGYEFADWGKSNLGSAAGQTQNSGLSLSHLYTNGVLLNLTCLS